MISTGINGLDEMLGGGIPQGSRVLYSMEPGVNGQLFMVSTLCSALASGLSCLVILPHTTVDAFLHDVVAMRAGSVELSSEHITFIDAIDRERIQKSTRSQKMAQKEWKARISKICHEREVEVIFAYFDLIYDDFGMKGGLDIIRPGRDGPEPTLIIEQLNLEGAPLLTRCVQDFTFDVVISINASYLPVPHFDYFTLVHISWSADPVRSVPFIVTEGRIVPYIPRIVVTGPAKSGKSTFVSSAADEGLSVERVGTEGDPTTVAMDFGLVHGMGFEITLYGTPGKPRFDALIPQMLRNTMGVILMLDATKPDSLTRAKQQISLIAGRRIPVVIAANKIDLPGRMSEAEIRTALGIKDDIPVFFLSATRRADVRYVLESLVDFITKFPY